MNGPTRVVEEYKVNFSILIWESGGKVPKKILETLIF